jgi:CBS domain-containing protein
MVKTYEVMTHALATCAPDTSVAQVAGIMRDRDIGNVLIVEDGKLRGIVTDRDLALQALTSKDDPMETPVGKYMSTKVITGEAGWSLERTAKMMAKNQVRRLPIVQDGQLVGIVSLGDVALNEKNRKDIVTKSLQAISTPPGIAVSSRSRISGVWISLGLAALAATTLVMFTRNRSGRALRKQIAKSDLYRSTQHAVGTARNTVDKVTSGKAVRDLRHQVRSNIKQISTQLPTLEYKPPKRRRVLFG